MKLKTAFPIAFLLFLFAPLIAQDKEILWSEDFEGAWYDNWYVNIGTWEVGNPTSGPQGAFKGNNCAATVLNGDYGETVDSRLIRYTSFTVPPASKNPAISFWHWWKTKVGDFGEVQLKTDQGDWETVSLRYERYGNGPWYSGLVDLSDYADSTVQLAFYFHSHSTGYGADVAPGWYIDEISLITGPDVFNDPEDFESGLDDWQVSMGTWDIGVPSSGPSNAHGGQNCAGTSLAGNYYEIVDSKLISPPFIVPKASKEPKLRFWHWWHFYSGDYGEVQIKTNRGVWEPISPRYERYGTDDWYRGILDLSNYGDSLVQIAFYFHSHSTDYGPDVAPGWYIDDITVAIGPYVVNNPEDFETGLNDWSVDMGTWEVGVPTYGPSNAYGGNNCAGTNLEGDYYELVDSRLISQPFKVPAASEMPAIRFWHWFKFYGGDWGEVQITTDKGETWQTITSQPISGKSESWSPFYIPITEFADSAIQLGFYFHSESTGYGADVSDGWYIDDIRIHDISELILYAGPDVTLESCGSTKINATVSGGTGPYIFNWIPALGLDDPTSLSPIANPSDTTVYTLKVTDSKGCFRTDRIVVNASCEKENIETDVLSFGFGKPPQTGEAYIDMVSNTVNLEVRYGSDLSYLIASFSLSEGATATVAGVDQLSGITTNDFTNPITYKITAEDGITVQDWIVTVSVAEADQPMMLSYGFGTPPQTSEAIIDPVTQTVDIKVEYGTDVTELVASFSLPEGASATVGGADQQSGITANNFTNPVTYSITAADGTTILEWVVNVVVAALNEADFLTFGFGIPPQTGDAVVNPVAHSVDIEVESETDVTTLTASFTLSDGATVKAGEVDQVSGVTTMDFTNPVTYTITASDNETVQDWTVTVEVASSVGIDGASIRGLKIYPNPFSDMTVIEVNNPEKASLNLAVYGVLGNKVFEKEILNSESITLKKGNLAKGVYWVILRGATILQKIAIVIE